MLTLQSSTQILIIAQGTSDGRRKRIKMPLTLNLPISAFVWFVSFSLALYETFDQATAPLVYFGRELYQTLFGDWSDDRRIIWLAIRSMFGGAYVGT